MSFPASLTEADLESSTPNALVLEDARSQIATESKAGGKFLVILDDDPTGSQAVQNIPVITSVEDKDLTWAFEQPSKSFFILTNSRAMNSVKAQAVLTAVVTSVERVAKSLNVEYSFMMRADSTLRGHFELESSLLLNQASKAGHPYDLVIFVPAYLDAGRITVDDVHWVKTDSNYIPVGKTDYAKDPAFSFENSSLPSYIEERTRGNILASDVGSISLSDIRIGGLDTVAEKFEAASGSQIFIANAIEESDLDILALAALKAESWGKRILYITGPSFVASRLGLETKNPLAHRDIFGTASRSGHGLIIVGSHVDITNRQLEQVAAVTPEVQKIEVDVSLLLDPVTAKAEIERCVETACPLLVSDEVMIATSRAIISGPNSGKSLEISKVISAALVEITTSILDKAQVAWLITKGGITSSDIITKAVEATRAMVAGQLFPGIVSVWVNKCQSKLSGLPLIVFAGNVGDETSLAKAIKILRGD